MIHHGPNVGYQFFIIDSDKNSINVLIYRSSFDKELITGTFLVDGWTLDPPCTGTRGVEGRDVSGSQKVKQQKVFVSVVKRFVEGPQFVKDPIPSSVSISLETHTSQISITVKSTQVCGPEGFTFLRDLRPVFTHPRVDVSCHSERKGIHKIYTVRTFWCL